MPYIIRPASVRRSLCALASAALFAFAAAGIWLVTATDGAMDQSAESTPAQALA